MADEAFRDELISFYKHIYRGALMRAESIAAKAIEVLEEILNDPTTSPGTGLLPHARYSRWLSVTTISGLPPSRLTHRRTAHRGVGLGESSLAAPALKPADTSALIPSRIPAS